MHALSKKESTHTQKNTLALLAPRDFSHDGCSKKIARLQFLAAQHLTGEITERAPGQHYSDTFKWDETCHHIEPSCLLAVASAGSHGDNARKWQLLLAENGKISCHSSTSILHPVCYLDEELLFCMKSVCMLFSRPFSQINKDGMKKDAVTAIVMVCL